MAVRFVSFIGGAEVRIDALQVKIGIAGQQRAQFWRVGGVYTQAVHPGVHFDVNWQGFAIAVGGGGKCKGGAGIVDCCSEVVLQQRVRKFRRRVAKQQYRGAHAGLTQGNCFVHGGDGESIGPSLQRRRRDQISAMAVGIRLDDRI